MSQKMIKEGLVYISGPISLNGTATTEQQEQFTKRFVIARNELKSRGYNVFDPTQAPQLPCWEEYMKYCLRGLTGVDCLVLLPRWQESRGSVLEMYVASQLKIPIKLASDIGV